MLTPDKQSNLDAAATLALDTEASTGIPASITLAQWALESGWGTAMPPGSNNPFGIKAVGDQPFVRVPTKEFIHGEEVTIEQNFRAFASLAEAFADHARLLTTGAPYRAAFAQFQADRDMDAFIVAMAKRYSTSPTYAAQLMSMIENSHIVAALQTKQSADGPVNA